MKPKILVYDIETTANLAWVWGKYDQNVIAFDKQWELLSFSAKWLGETKVQFFGRNEYTEEELVEKLHTFFDTADITIAHNGDSFDKRMANAKFLQFELDPPAPYKTIDTKKVAKKYFRLNSNSLKDLGNFLGLGTKVETGGFDLWLGCMRGNTKSWKLMEKYNKQDVKLLEKIYLKLRPWMDNHPSVTVISGIDGCPKCGHKHLTRQGFRHTKVGRYQRLKCENCGGWNQLRIGERTEITITN